MGHLGKDRALQLIRDPSYWFKMEDDVTSFCYQRLQLCPEKEIAHSCCCTHAFVFFSSTIIGLDFLHLGTSSSGYQYLLVLTNHF